MNTRIFESEGIFITIAFARNLDRIPKWKFIIENVEDCLHKSGRFEDRHECELESLKKAIEFLP